MENNFMESIKIKKTDQSIEYQKKQFLEKLTKNPSLLEYLSTDRLEKILQYYLDENEKKRKKLQKMTMN